MSRLSDYRRTKNRCTSVKVEYGTANASEQRRRSWRCQLVEGHKGEHVSQSGHRQWTDEEAGEPPMTDDLTERLRAKATIFSEAREWIQCQCPHCHLHREAADRIEKLEATLRDWEKNGVPR